MTADRGQTSLSREAGFTLVEMLVSVALLGLLSVLLLDGVTIGARVLEASRRQSDVIAHQSASYNFLRGVLARAQPLPRSLRAGEPAPIAFDGGVDKVTFITGSPAHLSSGGYQRLSLAVENTPGGQRLVAVWEPYEAVSVAAGDNRPRRSVLFDDLSGAEFRYFGRIDGAPQAGWSSVWRGQKVLPERIGLSLMPQIGRKMPDLIVALPLSNSCC